ncbi:MAG TPA: hypothetical protein VK528_11555 [Flavobacterium sp.]|nr:hypothetical protein [Flavobacterium sp.]
MKRILPFVFGLLVFCAGCSGNDDDNVPAQADELYFHFNENGTELSLYPQTTLDHSGVQRFGDIFYIKTGFGYGYDSEQQHQLTITFDHNGALISAVQESQSEEYGSYDYYSYKNFPSHYFNINIISIDEVNKRIKLTFSGTLFTDELDMNSESVDISGDLNMDYMEYEEITGIPYSQHYCNAKFNGADWVAHFEEPNGTFTASDAYRVQVHFGIDAAPNSYNFNSDSTENYVKFSKFNTVTLLWDYYTVNGVVAPSYREYHGNATYSFIGTFDFVATNPNDASDVIHVTDGTFRSFQVF